MVIGRLSMRPNFFLRDACGILRVMGKKENGAYQLEASRSAFYLANTRNFPRNTEVEVTLTFTSNEPGAFVEQVAPTAESLTVRERYSFVALPDKPYTPRAFDPRAGYFAADEYMDFAAPLGEPIVKRFIARHRLEKTNPSAAISDAVSPITYYVDRGAPEPIRSALVEGARWWSQAFEAAGFSNAFRVEVMPEGADLMDVRYNVIQWVPRFSRGWSYGSAVIDPRTGEILCGRVALDALRARQDYLIAEALLAPYEAGKPVPPDLERMVLARVRQLAAHEVGHTLGLAHNFAASTMNRASVMDYPHPLVTLQNGVPSFADAYATGIGEWDKVAISYGYSQAANSSSEKAALAHILAGAQRRGLYFITDDDSRPRGGAHPAAHLWDNNTNAVDELDRMMKVRAAALSRFGERNVREGTPMSELEDVLVPLYLVHRYQVEAASKVLGGVLYTYAVRGDGQTIAELVPGAEQRRALQALLATLDPQVLTFPDSMLRLLPPRASGYPRTPESFQSRTGLTFDPLAAAESAANLTVGQLLDPDRCSRLVEQHSRQPEIPGCAETLEAVVERTWKSPVTTGMVGEVRRVVNDVVLIHLFRLASQTAAGLQAQAEANQALSNLSNWLEKNPAADAAEQAHRMFAIGRIRAFQLDPKNFILPVLLPEPPGQPI